MLVKLNAVRNIMTCAYISILHVLLGIQRPWPAPFLQLCFDFKLMNRVWGPCIARLVGLLLTMLLILFIGGDKLLGHHKLRLSLGPVLTLLCANRNSVTTQQCGTWPNCPHLCGEQSLSIFFSVPRQHCASRPQH